ncbi:hypothetical protein Tco_1493936 [Tanacetum coccineum]
MTVTKTLHDLQTGYCNNPVSGVDIFCCFHVRSISVEFLTFWTPVISSPISMPVVDNFYPAPYSRDIVFNPFYLTIISSLRLGDGSGVSLT